MFNIFCNADTCKQIAIAHARAQAALQVDPALVARVSDADIHAQAAQPLAEIAQPYTLGHGFLIHAVEDTIQWISDHKTQIQAVVSVIMMIIALFPK
jgi:hypothetical protein